MSAGRWFNDALLAKGGVAAIQADPVVRAVMSEARMSAASQLSHP
jgi:hypothetical protein